MIVKLKLKDAKGEEITMLFGTSYKPYYIQVQEWLQNGQVWNYDSEHPRAFPTHTIESIEASKESWKGFGGLKSCPEHCFQEELNREGCQSEDPDNPSPRQYSEMVFTKNRSVQNKIESWYKKRYQGRAPILKTSQKQTR